MKLHRNAPLGPKGRAVMVRRAVEEGWSLMEAAAAAGMSERARSGAGATAPRASSASRTAPRRPRRSPTAPMRAGSRRSQRCGECG